MRGGGRERIAASIPIGRVATAEDVAGPILFLCSPGNPTGTPTSSPTPGSEPGTEINSAAVQAMREVGIDISGEYPKPWTDEIVRAADVIITMGCGDACPVFPGRRYEEWVLPDPAGQDVDAVRPIRDDIENRIRALLGELAIPVDA